VGPRGQGLPGLDPEPQILVMFISLMIRVSGFAMVCLEILAGKVPADMTGMPVGQFSMHLCGYSKHIDLRESSSMSRCMNMMRNKAEEDIGMFPRTRDRWSLCALFAGLQEVPFRWVFPSF